MGARLTISLFSGGKDSLLTILKCLKRRKKKCEVVFVDTGWEAEATYTYIQEIDKLLRERYGIPVKVLKPTPLKEVILRKGFFPSYRRRFCTFKLKIEPFFEYLLDRYHKEKFEKVEIWSGVRWEESPSRRDRKPIEIFKKGEKIAKGIPKLPFDVIYVHPILFYTYREVFEEIRAEGFPLNPLYERGHKRVGCYPCLASERSIKDVIKDSLLGNEFSRKRIEEIKEMENILGRKVKEHSIDELIKIAKKEYLSTKQKSLFTTI